MTSMGSNLRLRALLRSYRKSTRGWGCGVTYDLNDMLLKIKPSRKVELEEEISSILERQVFQPGQAGKLRGKLMFGASQLWGKIGKAFLRSLSERQYLKMNHSKLNKALVLSLKQWLWLISEGPPRPIEFTKPRVPDFVVFTDGSFPDGSEGFPNVPWIGGVLFQKGAQPLQFGAAVDFSLDVDSEEVADCDGRTLCHGGRSAHIS